MKLGAAFMLLSAGALLATAGQAKDPPSREAAIAAADAAAGLPAKIDPNVPVCASPPPSGEKLAGDMKVGSGGHGIEISNDGGGDALVNIRHAATHKLAMRFYLRSMESMTIDGVPDGHYLLQYGFGPALAPDCKSFTRLLRARELPEADDLVTQTIETADQTEVKHRNVSYQLSVTENANVKPVKIDAAAFNAE